MSEPTVTATLTPAEWKLINEIRNIPGDTTQSRVHEILGEFLFYVRNPRCQGVMPEGFPCGDPRSTCEQCHQVWDLLEEIEARVAHI
jgi:hypothetical protein